MARAMLVGCGCCARRAGQLLLDQGWAVRGTSRDPAGRELIAAAGLEAAEANPDRVGSIAELLGDVTVLAWLLGSAAGPDRDLLALQAERLPSLLAKLVDTPVRGFVFEAAGTIAPEALGAGRSAAEDAARRWRIPVGFVETDRADADAWAREVASAVTGVIGSP